MEGGKEKQMLTGRLLNIFHNTKANSQYSLSWKDLGKVHLEQCSEGHTFSKLWAVFTVLLLLTTMLSSNKLVVMNVSYAET